MHVIKFIFEKKIINMNLFGIKQWYNQKNFLIRAQIDDFKKLSKFLIQTKGE